MARFYAQAKGVLEPRFKIVNASYDKVAVAINSLENGKNYEITHFEVNGKCYKIEDYKLFEEFINSSEIVDLKLNQKNEPLKTRPGINCDERPKLCFIARNFTKIAIFGAVVYAAFLFIFLIRLAG